MNFKVKDINLIEVEKLIGIEFENKGVLITALTHSSYANQFKDVKYNERLEFLGDSVLQLCVTKYLFNKKQQDFVICKKFKCSQPQSFCPRRIFFSKVLRFTGRKCKRVKSQY